MVTHDRPSGSSLLNNRSLRCLLLVLLGLGARFPALQGQLIWDDRLLVQGNPLIRSPVLILEAFRHYLFPGTYSGHYRPVQTVSYIFDYLIWNADTFGYHLSNLCFHLSSALLLYFLLTKLLAPLSGLNRKSEIAAFLVALLWAVHPVHSGAVDYISGRADSLAFLFSCAGWLLYLHAPPIKRPLIRLVLFGLAAISGLLALCSRESGFI